jgi:hypothetical protein
MIDPYFNESNIPEDSDPWMNLRGTIYGPPAMKPGKCFNRSVLFYDDTCEPSAENNNCLYYLPNLFNATWFAVGAGICVGGFPDQNSITLEDSIPTEGNLAMTISNQCGVSNVGPTGNATSVVMYTLTDPDGNRYALQSMNEPYTNETTFDEYLSGAVLPDGWEQGKETLTEVRQNLPYLVGENCFIVLALDNLGNQYHMFDYKVPLVESIVLQQTNCTVMNNPSGVAGLMPPAPAPAPAPASGSATMSVLLSFVCILVTMVFMMF